MKITPAGPAGTATNPFVPRNAQEYRGLKAGSYYIDQDGTLVKKGAN
jgi:hypothetical protein